MIPEGTERRRCKRCHKIILLPKVVPCEERLFINGVWLEYMDRDCETRNVGGLCFECAFLTPAEEVMFEGFDFSMGFSGGHMQDLDLWSALISDKLR